MNSKAKIVLGIVFMLAIFLSCQAAQETKPGLAGTYFSSSGFKNPIPEPDFLLSVDEDWASGRGNDWSARWKGFIQAPVTSDVNFSVFVADYVKIKIGDTLVIDATKDGGTQQGTFNMQNGKKYPIFIDYECYHGEGKLKLFWQWKGQPRVIIPFYTLSYDPDAFPKVPIDPASEPVRYIGERQTDKRFFDGAISHAVGTHSYQAFRANRTHPSEGGDIGWTYNHQPYLSYWNGKFYFQYLSNLVSEHEPPGRTLLMVSKDGRKWSNPKVVFPKYPLPEIKKGEHMAPADVPAGTYSVMHQRMGFYLAPNDRLLTLAFYGFCATSSHSPNTGNGLGRVVREIYKDGTFGPIYFIRYNHHAGWNETNTDYPFYKTSSDEGFVQACESILADKLMSLQWWEEDRGKDGFYVLDPGDVNNAYEFTADMVSSRGAGKAFCFYRRPDNVVVGLWKNQWSALSKDNGKNWLPITKSSTLKVCGAKLWGQRTDDGKYALVYDHTQIRGNRFPMVVMTGEDGREFDNMLCLQGQVPPMRYKGRYKVWGPQYIRGIMPGNGNPPGDHLWNVYSMNKEDIWVTRTHLPVTGAVDEYVKEDFEKAQTEADLELWNFYVPKWAPISITANPKKENNKCLQFTDEEPYDYALAERTFPESKNVTVQFNLHAKQRKNARLEVDIVNKNGVCPIRIMFTEDGNIKALAQDNKIITLMPYNDRKWMSFRFKIDCAAGLFTLTHDGIDLLKNFPFANKTDTVERLVFRTGKYRRDVPGKYEGNDLENADACVRKAIFYLDNVSVNP